MRKNLLVKYINLMVFNDQCSCFNYDSITWLIDKIIENYYFYIDNYEMIIEGLEVTKWDIFLIFLIVILY